MALRAKFGNLRQLRFLFTKRYLTNFLAVVAHPDLSYGGCRGVGSGLFCLLCRLFLLLFLTKLRAGGSGSPVPLP